MAVSAGFSQDLEKKKNYRNRVVRRKSKNLLHEVEDHSLHELGPTESITPRSFSGIGLSKKTVRKIGIVYLREKIPTKKERRENRGETRREQKQRLALICVERIVALERDSDSIEAKKIIDPLRFGDGRLWEFLSDYPDLESSAEVKNRPASKGAAANLTIRPN
jgi:hypothetical protein